jgi:hypothetical protein
MATSAARAVMQRTFMSFPRVGGSRASYTGFAPWIHRLPPARTSRHISHDE